MKKILICLSCLSFLFACDKNEEVVPTPVPDIAGEWVHKYNILNDLTFTEDSLHSPSSTNTTYEQLNDSIMVLDNNSNPRTVNYKLINNSELYFSYGRSYNNNPLKFGKDSVIYEIYER